MLVSETAQAEAALLRDLVGNDLADLGPVLQQYPTALSMRLEAWEARLLDEWKGLEGEIADRTDLLSGNEEENKGLTDPELDPLSPTRGLIQRRLLDRRGGGVYEGAARFATGLTGESPPHEPDSGIPRSDGRGRAAAF